MLRKLFLISFLVLNYSISAQSSLQKYSASLNRLLEQKKNDEKTLVWIFFKDKQTDASIMYKASDLISVRAIKRRAKVLDVNSIIAERDYPVSEKYLYELKKLGVEIKQKTKWFNGVSAYLDNNTIEKIAGLDFVKSVDAVASFKKEYNVIDSSSPVKNQMNKIDQTHYSHNYGESLTQVEQINAAAVHDLGINGEGVLICVMDAGFNRLSHEVFSTLDIVAKWDFVNNDGDVGDGSDMGEGSHGTQTLSCIGGFKEGKLIGTAYKASFLLAKTENTDSETPIEEDNWIAAVEWAEGLGVDVTSTSLGYIGFDSPHISYTWASMDGDTPRITAGADLAAQLGVVVVNSAGNEGMDLSHNTLGAPADGDSVIAIGAVTSTGSRSSFSSVGNTVDGRIKPDVMAMGSSVRVASPYSNSGYTNSSGTSFSCPLAAGVAALILQANPSLTPMEVRDAMRETASQANLPNRFMGWGILNALQAVNYFSTPVELISFNASFADGKIILRWSTATETNNSGFEVLRSIDKLNWDKITFVNGNGTSTEIQKYFYTDIPNADKSIHYYRLKQIDFDGSQNYSKIVEVSVHSPEDFRLYNNYPNPFNPETSIKYALPENAVVKISLYDLLGCKIRDLVDDFLQAGNHEVILNASDLASGIYFVRMQTGDFSDCIKINLIR